MDALPNLYLTWTPSTEPLSSFLRYQVYRRVLGDAAWVKVARITDRSIAFFQDFAAASGVSYEYAVTVVKAADDGEEVESAFPTSVSAAVTFIDSFLHAVRTPSVYAQIDVQSQSLPVAQDVVMVQVWGRSAPTAHVGTVESTQVQFKIQDSWLTDSALWVALRAIVPVQRTAGTVLCYRDARATRLFCQIVALQRDDTFVGYGASGTLQEVYYQEAVA